MKSVNEISKAIDFGEDDRTWFQKTKFYSWYIESKLVRWCHDNHWKLIGKPWFDLVRSYEWHKNVFHNDFDFDAHSIFGVLEYKLKRIQKSLQDGYAIQESKDMKALALAIKLAGRAKEDQYEQKFADRHEKRWGRYKNFFTRKGPIDFNRTKVFTEQDKEDEHRDFLAYYEAAYKMQTREKNWLFAIIVKYGNVWWD